MFPRCSFGAAFLCLFLASLLPLHSCFTYNVFAYNKSEIRVLWLYPSPISDFGYSFSLDRGRLESEDIMESRGTFSIEVETLFSMRWKQKPRTKSNRDATRATPLSCPPLHCISRLRPHLQKLTCSPPCFVSTFATYAPRCHRLVAILGEFESGQLCRIGFQCSRSRFKWVSLRFGCLGFDSTCCLRFGARSE